MPRRVALNWRNRLLLGIFTTLAVAQPVLLPRPAHAGAGRIREFVVPTSSSHPGGITLGPDGAVWFTEIATNAIGRLQGGTFTAFPLPRGGRTDGHRDRPRWRAVVHRILG
jgi:streptogramin lyase